MTKTVEPNATADTAKQYERIGNAATIMLHGAIDRVFPLFGPVREKLWAHGWEPEIVYATSQEPEERMIFRTRSAFPEEAYYTWTVSQYRPSAWLIEYVVTTPNRLWFIRVRCEAVAGNTSARIAYTYTALNDLGTALNRVALDKLFDRNLMVWEVAINHYLQTGNMLIN